MDKVIPYRKDAIPATRFLDKQRMRLAEKDSLLTTSLNVGDGHTIQAMLRSGNGAVLLRMGRQEGRLMATAYFVGFRQEVVIQPLPIDTYLALGSPGELGQQVRIARIKNDFRELAKVVGQFQLFTPANNDGELQGSSDLQS